MYFQSLKFDAEEGGVDHIGEKIHVPFIDISLDSFSGLKVSTEKKFEGE